MENRSHALAAGLFLILLSALALSAVVWFRGDHIERRPVLVVTRDSITGLNIKAPVRLRGVDVGKVESISFDPANPSQILIGLQITRAAPLTRATYAQLGFQGVTGLAFVALADTGKDPRPLPESSPGSPAPRISLEPTLLDQLTQAGPRLINGATEATQHVNELLSDGNRAQLAQSLAALHVSLDQVNQLLASLQPAASAMPLLVQHVDTASREADVLLGHADETLSGLRQPLGRLDHAVEDFDTLASEAGGLTRELRSRAVVLDQLGSAAAQLEASTRHLEVALGTDGSTPTAPLLPEFGRTTQNLQTAIRQISEQPQSLLVGRSVVAPGPGEAGFRDQPAGEHRP